jgi:hypothetical protein
VIGRSLKTTNRPGGRGGSGSRPSARARLRRRSTSIAAKSGPDFGRWWNLRSSSRFIRLEIAFSIVEPTEFVDWGWMCSAL